MLKSDKDAITMNSEETCSLKDVVSGYVFLISMLYIAIRSTNFIVFSGCGLITKNSLRGHPNIHLSINAVVALMIPASV